MRRGFSGIYTDGKTRLSQIQLNFSAIYEGGQAVLASLQWDPPTAGALTINQVRPRAGIFAVT